MALLHLHSCYAIGSSSPLCVAVYTALLSIVCFCWLLMIDIHQLLIVTNLVLHLHHKIEYKLTLNACCSFFKNYLYIHHIRKALSLWGSGIPEWHLEQYLSDSFWAILQGLSPACITHVVISYKTSRDRGMDVWVVQCTSNWQKQPGHCNSVCNPYAIHHHLVCRHNAGMTVKIIPSVTATIFSICLFSTDVQSNIRESKVAAFN